MSFYPSKVCLIFENVLFPCSEYFQYRFHPLSVILLYLQVFLPDNMFINQRLVIKHFDPKCQTVPCNVLGPFSLDLKNSNIICHFFSKTHHFIFENAQFIPFSKTPCILDQFNDYQNFWEQINYQTCQEDCSYHKPDKICKFS